MVFFFELYTYIILYIIYIKHSYEQINENILFTGRITAYGISESKNKKLGEIAMNGSCAFSHLTEFVMGPKNYLFVALNQFQYEYNPNGYGINCGRCIEIQCNNFTSCPNKKVDALITDRCPECPKYALDLSPNIWNIVTGKTYGISQVKWKFIECNPNTKEPLIFQTISYYWKNESNIWSSNLQFRNFKKGIRKMILKDNNGKIIDSSKFPNNNLLAGGNFYFKINNVKFPLIITLYNVVDALSVQFRILGQIRPTFEIFTPVQFL